MLSADDHAVDPARLASRKQVLCKVDHVLDRVRLASRKQVLSDDERANKRDLHGAQHHRKSVGSRAEYDSI